MFVDFSKSDAEHLGILRMATIRELVDFLTTSVREPEYAIR